MMKERYALMMERIAQIETEETVKEPYGLYFKQVASFLLQIGACFEEIGQQGLFQTDVSILKRWNEQLYAPLLPATYMESYVNQTYAVQNLGKELGALLSFVYAELFSMIPACFEQDLEEITIRMEWFVELYGAFCQEDEEGKAAIPSYDKLQQIIYWFVTDYMEDEMEKRIRAKVDPEENFAKQIMEQSDLSDPSYLYRFGEYISADQIETAKYLAKMPKEKLKLMADTYTEGYRIGFIKGEKDLSKKKVAQIVYPLGFESMIRLAIDNFYRMGLDVTIMRTPHSIFDKRGMAIGGYYSTSPNKQFEFDHKEDEAIFLDKKFVGRKLEASRDAYEKVKNLAKVHAGPAWVEIFGEEPFNPVTQSEAFHLDEKQQKLSVQYLSQNGQMINEYIPGEERSFTIIAFPIPQIGKEYAAIMEETIALNTLDYKTYEDIQQCIIDALDKAERVVIKGADSNRTFLTVQLIPVRDATKETKFENCVADVNIPVGEVFTSPVLAGTEGILQVSSVYLNELEYKNLWLSFTDGCVTDYGCDNFDSEEENRKYIKDNVLFHHDTLPMGEFAIGTNTVAYSMGRKYKIQGKLPILIAEKTGPHFAVGDTCYSHAEDVKVYNADGKEIIARDNAVSILRKTNQDKAYFQCHTDITIPYDELGEITGICQDGSEIAIIKNGRFVLPGTEKLNEALD